MANMNDQSGIQMKIHPLQIWRMLKSLAYQALPTFAVGIEVVETSVVLIISYPDLHG